MLPEIITYNKSMIYRLQEYQELFANIETPCSEIVDIWASVFEDLVIVGLDWTALWILSEDNCRKYDLLFPTAVIVNVNDFEWKNLSANVKVKAVQEDIELPLELDVPIIELHPIKFQNYDETALKNIEDWLDKCRYFFTHLWYPWDAKLNVSLMDWCESHLKNRLKMQYDIKNGVFGKVVTNYLKSLLKEAQNISNISEISIYQDDVDERLAVVKKYIRRKIIKTELDLFEEPYLRGGMILLKKMENNLKFCNEKTIDKEAKFVWLNGNCESLMHYLKVAQPYVDNKIPLKVYKSLEEALDASNTNDIVLLPPGEYIMNSLSGLENGGMIRGLDKTGCIITPDMSTIPRAILLECFGLIEIENVTISKLSGIIVQVFSETLKISNCRFSSKNDSTSKGIVLLPGCELFLENSTLQGFGTAITLQAETRATISNTKITECHEGIKILDNAALSIREIEISSCSSFGMRVESSEVDLEMPSIGDLNLIEENELPCEINCNSITFIKNKKGNVIIKRSEKVLYDKKPSDNNTSNEVIWISDSDSSIDDIDDTNNS